MPAIYRTAVRSAEYIAVAASLIGAIATLSTQQVAYAIAPLSLSVALSLVSRRQEQQLEPRLNKAISQFNHEIDRIEQQNTTFKRNLTVLSESFSQALNQGVQQVTHQHDAAFSTLTQKLTTENLSLNQHVKAISAELDDLKASLAQQTLKMDDFASVASFETLQTTLEQIETSFNTLVDQTENTLERHQQTLDQQQTSEQQQAMVTGQIAMIESEIQTLQVRFSQYVSERGQQTSGFVPASHFNALAKQLEKFQGELNELSARGGQVLEKRLQELMRAHQQTALDQQVMLTGNITRIENDLANLHRNVSHIQQSLSNLIVQFQAFPEPPASPKRNKPIKGLGSKAKKSIEVFGQQVNGHAKKL